MTSRPPEFVSTLCALRFENTFNPYSDVCSVHDRRDAPKQRASMLLAMLEAATNTEVDSLWVGRDLGHRGGRRTGLALTDDVHIGLHARRWNLSANRPTKGQAVSERTAAVIWSVLDTIANPIFLWNVFPLHPHAPNEPFSNRTHNARERAAGEAILADIVRLLAPKRIVAIGADAAKSAARVSQNQPTLQVRHPSYGGQTEFLAQINRLYRCERALLL